MKFFSSIIVLALLVASCSDSGTSPENRSFNLKFSYGVNARNVLNTFEDTYTKDLAMDGIVTVSFPLCRTRRAPHFYGVKARRLFPEYVLLNIAPEES